MNPENTLLGLLTGGRYSQSSDLPTAKQVGSSAIDSIIESDNKRKSKVLFESGKNIFGKPTKEFTQGDLDDLISGFAGTTKPIMSKLGLSKKVPRNPLYHITNIKNIKSILDKGILPLGGRASFTRDPNLKQVYGQGEKRLQLMVDKDLVEKFSGKKLSPYQYVGGRPEGKGGLRFEAEERLTGEGLGAPISSIKAIRVRNNTTKFDEKKYPWQKELNDFKTILETNEYKTLLTSASKRNIPLIIDKNEKSFIGSVLKEIDKEALSKGQSMFLIKPSEIIKKNIYYIGKNK